MDSGQSFLVGVIGNPVGHSISPAMQQPALDALGVRATYERWQTSEHELQDRITQLRAPNVLGANVTVPHKRAVMPLLDEISDLAQRAGAVNTIVNRSGRLLGDNTDIYGFARSLREACPDCGVGSAMVLGAGGAARAVILGLAETGVREIGVHNRDPERASALANDLRPITVRVLQRRDVEDALSRAGVLINATALGWHAGEIPLDPALLELLPAGALVMDLTYRDTDLLLAARARGISTVDGLPMLVYQGARALELWTGRPAPVDVMMRAALAARAPAG